jgi:hypothetical protein
MQRFTPQLTGAEYEAQAATHTKKHVFGLLDAISANPALHYRTIERRAQEQAANDSSIYGVCKVRVDDGRLLIAHLSFVSDYILCLFVRCTVDGCFTSSSHHTMASASILFVVRSSFCGGMHCIVVLSAALHL